MGQSYSRTSDSLNYVTITKKKLTDTINALNSRCEETFTDGTVNMIFAVQEANIAKKTFLLNDLINGWKKTVRIRCFSVRNERAYSKSYTLYDFLRFYNSFLQILDASNASNNTDELVSDDRIMKMSIFQEEWCSIDGKCIICMDRKPDAVLPCAHAYCERCIKAFLGIRQKCCPLCRHKLDASVGGGEAWVIAEKPVREVINAYLVDGSDGSRSEDDTKEGENVNDS